VGLSPTDSSRVQLYSTRGDALAGTNAIALNPSVATGTAHHLRHVFDPATAVNSITNSILVGRAAGLVTGDEVQYDNGGGTSIGGLVDKGTYYVSLSPTDSTRVRLHSSRTDA